MSKRFKGTINSEFTLNIDLAATILGAAGLDPLESMMGRDMSQLYRKGGLSGPAISQSRRKASAPREKRRFPEPAADGNGRYHSGSKNAWRTECECVRVFGSLYKCLTSCGKSFTSTRCTPILTTFPRPRHSCEKISSTSTGRISSTNNFLISGMIPRR